MEGGYGWDGNESPHARIPVPPPPCTPPPHSPPLLRPRLFILGRVHSCVVCSHRIQGSHSAGPRSQVPAARSADDLIAHQAHSAVSRPRPRMDSLGRKRGGGRGGTDGMGMRVRTRASLHPPPCTPLPTHLLPYVPGCSSSDVFTAASGVHTGSQIPATRRRSADDVIVHHAPHRRVTATSEDGQPGT